VAEVVRTEIGAISLQAVYDALGLLVSEGLIRRIQPSGSPARYEDRVGDNHHHLICRICGRVVDVDCAVGSTPCLTPSHDRGYEIDEAEVAYWGRCPDCLDGSRSSASASTRTANAANAKATKTAKAATTPPTQRKRIPRSNNRRTRRSSSRG
jgi:Fe2+ or Zn2+ uptake regulation protein